MSELKSGVKYGIRALLSGDKANGYVLDGDYYGLTSSGPKNLGAISSGVLYHADAIAPDGHPYQLLIIGNKLKGPNNEELFELFELQD